MPAVFVHGVPDTASLWEPLKRRLSRKDIQTLALPGFRSPSPAGFTSTKEEYVSWIISEIEALGEPVDLVGHDWGCILTMRVASVRPDLVRTWAAGSGPVSPEYEWHSLAKIWQAPGQGEKWMEDFNPRQLATFMTEAGLPHEQATESVERIDEPMKQSILRLYRSALNVGKEWQPGLKNASAPGLVFWGRDDTACPVRFAYDLGRDGHANRVLTFDSGHWVVVQRAEDIAHALETHWSAGRER